jgi:6-pyruvoyltetrahydropterin/6-carboxytetrahydropterin synthase
MFTTTITHDFEVHHFLRGDFGAESQPHSHPYRLEWRIKNTRLDENGFATDIAWMEKIAEELLTPLKGQLLNDLPYFKSRQPSLENLCVYLWNNLDSQCKANKQHSSEMEIRIWENDHAWAAYSALTNTK